VKHVKHGTARRLMALIAAGLGLLGCPDSWTGPKKNPVSAVWIGPGTEVPDASRLARLEELGIGEIFVEAAELDLASGGAGLRRFDLPRLPPSTPVTLVASGRWPGGDFDLGEAAVRVAEEAQQARFDAEGQGLIPVGLHFDPRGVDSLSRYADFLDELQGELDRTLFLSTTVERSWLDDSALDDVVGEVDFAVPLLYGQRLGEREDPAAWDFVILQRQLEVFDELGTPYLVGIVTLGTAAHLGRNDGVKDRSTAISLQKILWDRNFKLEHGFALEGGNRQVYTVRAQRGVRVGEWVVRQGEAVRVVRPTTFHLEEVESLLGVWALPGYLGRLYYRLPEEGERLSLTLDNLTNALEPGPAAPDLEFDAAVRRRIGRGWLFEFSLTNANGEVTDFSLIDNNYLQIHAPGKTFGQVDVGDFYRYELFRTSDTGELERTHRQPDVLRLYAPMLEGRQTLLSGAVQVLGRRGSPNLELEVRFVLPNGGELELGPYTWRDGELDTGEEGEDQPTPEEEPAP